ncbi:MAG: ABC transporter permease subunit [Aeromicrobium sp.]
MNTLVAERTGGVLKRAIKSESIKLTTLRSTWWNAASMIVLGAGFTTIICGVLAGDVGKGQGGDSAGELITQGLIFSQISAVVLGALVVTSEYGTGMIRATLAATPGRGTVLAAKALVLSSFLFVVGTLTAFLGYFGGNVFLKAEGVGISLTDDNVLRSMFGAGLYMAGLGLLAAAIGLLVRHTAAAISIVLGLVFIIGQVVQLIPGTTGEWIMKLMPGNAGPGIVVPVPFGDPMLDPWTGFAVFVAEIAVVAFAGMVLFKRKDA